MISTLMYKTNVQNFKGPICILVTYITLYFENVKKPKVSGKSWVSEVVNASTCIQIKLFKLTEPEFNYYVTPTYFSHCNEVFSYNMNKLN